MSAPMDIESESKSSPQPVAASPTAATSAASSSSTRIVFPGDSLSVSGTGIRLGNGLVQSSLVPTFASSATNDSSSASAAGGRVTVTKCGILRKGLQGKLWIDNAQKRYIPSVDDLVVGTIIEKHAESYRVDIGTTQPAVLPALAFEGATKRNKPNLNVGSLLYARVQIAHRDIECELTCISPHFKKDWVTGQSLYGELLGGYQFSCSTQFARELLEEECYVLRLLGKYVPFELSIGMNGRIWINSASPLHTILLVNAIQNSEAKSKEHITSMVQKIMQAL